MNINQLRPVNQLINRFGVKCIMYGGPGSGKTPILTTAPRPVICVIEPGMLSMRGSNIPAWEAYTPEKIDEFFDWIKRSPEAKNFDTVAIDSVSEMAEVYLKREKAKKSHGLKAYGDMAEIVKDHLNTLLYMPEKHAYMIAKEGLVDFEGVKKRRPYFPGQELNSYVPHMFDEVLHLGLEQVGTMPTKIKAIRTAESFDCMARDRSGRLNELEEPHLGKLFTKAMS